MKKLGLVLVVGVVALVLPLAAYALQAPTDFKGDAETSSVNSNKFNVKLDWVNRDSYDSIKIIRDEADLITSHSFPPSSQLYLDTNAGQGFTPGVHTYQLEVSKGVDSAQADTSVFIPMPEDSNIVIVKTTTSEETPTPAEIYTLTCLGSTTSTITLGWSGNVTGPHTLNLYRSTSASGISGGSRTLIAPPPTLSTGTGFCTDAGGGTGANWCLSTGPGLTKDTNYWYLLAWGTGTSSSTTQQCRTLAEGTDTPTKLNVWALSPASLFVNWKDNSVRPHTFALQRVKLTPAQPTFPYTDGGGKVKNPETVSDTAIKLYWKNDTNTQTPKGPYYHLAERSTSSTPFVDRNEKGKCKYTGSQAALCDPSFTELPWAFADDVDVTKVSTIYTIYEQTDSGLTEGTDYYYRMKGCSFVRADVTREQPPPGPQNDEHEDICGAYQDAVAYLVGTSTLPASPQGVEFTNVTENEISFRWKDYSQRESGFAVTVSPAPGGTGNCATGQCTAPVNAATPPAGQAYSFTVPFTINGLQPGTPYTVTVRAYRDGPWGRAFSSGAPSNSTTTDPYVAVASPSGGTIGGDCTSGSTCYFDYNTSVTLTATAEGGYKFTRWTDGPCTNSTNPTCTFTITGNVSVNALFTKALQETVSVNAFVGATATSTAFNFSLVDPNGQTVASGTTAVPFTSVADYPVGSDKKFTFTYVSGGPPGMTFDKIVWSNSTGAGVQPTGISTGQGFISEDGGWLKYDVYFTAAGGMLPAPSFYANITSSFRTVAGLVERLGDRVAARAAALARDLAAAVRGLFATAAASVELRTVGGVTLTRAQLDAYFDRFTPSGWQGANAERDLSVFTDTGLEANTAYLYRVRACSGSTCTPYSEEAAGKTLPAGAAGTGEKVGICTRNSLCELMTKYSFTPAFGVSPITTEEQCRNNGHCRDVGTSRQFFEETR